MVKTANQTSANNKDHDGTCVLKDNPARTTSEINQSETKGTSPMTIKLCPHRSPMVFVALFSGNRYVLYAFIGSQNNIPQTSRQTPDGLYDVIRILRKLTIIDGTFYLAASI